MYVEREGRAPSASSFGTGLHHTLQAGKLNAAEQQLFHEILEARRGFHGSRPWIQNLTAWVRRTGSKPRRDAENRLERMQATRWSKAQGLLKLGHLKPVEEQLLGVKTLGFLKSFILEGS